MNYPLSFPNEEAFSAFRAQMRERLLISRHEEAHHFFWDPGARIGAMISIEHLKVELETLAYGQGPRPGIPQLVQIYFDLNGNDLRQYEQELAGLAPEKRHLQESLAFAGGFFEKNDIDRFLIHCFAGISRSTATMLAILAMLYGPGRENEAVQDLLSIRILAAPNLLLVAYADELLERGGKLMQAVKNDELISANERAVAPHRSAGLQYWLEQQARKVQTPAAQA